MKDDSPFVFAGQSEQPPGKDGVDEDGGKRRLLFLCH
jgi:hypothetical protein